MLILFMTSGCSALYNKQWEMLPTDTDKDGVVDARDQCPLSPAGGDVDDIGCSDEIRQFATQTPLPAPGESNDRPNNNRAATGSGIYGSGQIATILQQMTTRAGPIPGRAVPTDLPPSRFGADRPGCPGSLAGRIDANGDCLPDADADGVLDRFDRCPDTLFNATSPSGPDGCPVRQSRVWNDIHFGVNSALVTSYSIKILRELAPQILRELKANPTLLIELAGHADGNEGAAAEQRSALRAENTLTALMVNGVPESRFVIRGYGDTEPLVPNDSDANRLTNRRVEIRFLE